MKKILGGCLIVLVIAVVGFAVASFYAYRAARPMFESAGDYLERARELANLGERVNNKSDFVAPDTGELTASQVERFVAVQSRVRSELGSRWSEVETKAADIQARAKDGQRELSFAEVTSLFSDFAAIYVEARRAQVTALNVHKFSDDEYAWVRRQVYAAAGLELAGTIDFSAIQDMARQGAEKGGVTLPDVPTPKVPETNANLVRPHASKIKEWLPMAVLGL
jgi:hypothetical protein